MTRSRRPASLLAPLLASLLAVASLGCPGEAPRSGRPDSPAVPRALAQIRYTSVDALVFVPVQLPGGQRREALLDSGFEYSVVDSTLAGVLGLRTSPTRDVREPGGTVTQSWARSMVLQVGPVAFRAESIGVLPVGAMAGIIDHPVDLILGHDFFSRYVVDIDYAAGMLRLYEPATFRYQGPGESIPVMFDSGQAFIGGVLDQSGHPSINARLKLDTGSLDILGLNGSFVQRAGLVPPDQHKIPAPGAALGGATRNWVTRLSRLTVGRAAIDWPIVGYSTDLRRGGDAGTIGGGFLRRFRVIFDYGRRRIILERAAESPTDSEYDMSGLMLVAQPGVEDGYAVLSVDAASPASRAGIVPGDVITATDGHAVRALGLTAVRALLKSAGPHVLRGRRGGSTRTDTLHLEPRI